MATTATMHSTQPECALPRSLSKSPSKRIRRFSLRNAAAGFMTSPTKIKSVSHVASCSNPLKHQHQANVSQTSPVFPWLASPNKKKRRQKHAVAAEALSAGGFLSSPSKARSFFVVRRRRSTGTPSSPRKEVQYIQKFVDKTEELSNDDKDNETTTKMSKYRSRPNPNVEESVTLHGTFSNYHSGEKTSYADVILCGTDTLTLPTREDIGKNKCNNNVVHCAPENLAWPIREEDEDSKCQDTVDWTDDIQSKAVANLEGTSLRLAINTSSRKHPSRRNLLLRQNSNSQHNLRALNMIQNEEETQQQVILCKEMVMHRQSSHREMAHKKVLNGRLSRSLHHGLRQSSVEAFRFKHRQTSQPNLSSHEPGRQPSLRDMLSQQGKSLSSRDLKVLRKCDSHRTLMAKHRANSHRNLLVEQEQEMGDDPVDMQRQQMQRQRSHRKLMRQISKKGAKMQRNASLRSLGSVDSARSNKSSLGSFLYNNSQHQEGNERTRISQVDDLDDEESFAGEVSVASEVSLGSVGNGALLPFTRSPYHASPRAVARNTVQSSWASLETSGDLSKLPSLDSILTSHSAHSLPADESREKVVLSPSNISRSLHAPTSPRKLKPFSLVLGHEDPSDVSVTSWGALSACHGSDGIHETSATTTTHS